MDKKNTTVELKFECYENEAKVYILIPTNEYDRNEIFFSTHSHYSYFILYRVLSSFSDTFWNSIRLDYKRQWLTYVD